MIRNIAASFTLTVLLLIGLMLWSKFAPFGNLSFVAGDGEIQYIDLFAYLRHFFLDGVSATFSFDKSLGGNMWAIMTYYLFSPLNILIVFFPQEELHSFYDLLVVLKLSLSAATMSYYLEQRFEHKLDTFVTILLSVGFGLMNYNVQQMVNLMWLDPVYMLPLMLLGVHKLRTVDNIVFLTVTMALAIIFNWYTGLIAVMFAGMFAVWEYVFFSELKLSWQSLLRFTGKVMLSITLAVGLSAVIFLPTLEALTAGKGSPEWFGLNASLYTKVLTIFEGLTWGNRSTFNQVALYTGDLVTFGFIAFFLQKNISKRQLIGGAVAVIFIWLMFYWRPLVFLFSLLKSPITYWYRYSFPAHFLLVYLAAFFFLYHAKLPQWRFQAHKLYIFLLSLYPVAVLWRHFKRPLQNWDTDHFNTADNVIGSLLVYSAVAAFFCLYPKLKSNSIKLCKTVLSIMIIFGLGTNTKQYIEFFACHNVDHYKDYVEHQSEQIDNIKQKDSSIYRINQTKNYEPFEENTDPDAFNANFNENLAYNYSAPASYTSSPISSQLALLDHLGYREVADCMSIVRLPILPTDSLLGVKYILSDEDIVGLSLMPELGVHNGKSTYLNEFAIPFAFVCNDFDLSSIKYDGNTFTYTNSIYKELFGVDVYKELPCQVTTLDNRHFTFEVFGVDNHSAIYGDMATQVDYKGKLNIDDKRLYTLSRFNSPSVFYVPQPAKDSVHFDFTTELEVNEQLNPQFYMVDFAALSAARDRAQSRAVNFLQFGDKYIKMQITAEEGEKLFTTIPYEGWYVKINGKPVTVEVVLDCFIGLTLKIGDNIIEMEYSMPGLKLGASITIISLILLMLIQKQISKSNLQ
ncbi:MAG: YfhO family protein [Selenomonadaceae bacterium]|nr:YfhO family protein [Selenomonadaceae bacterium]